VKGNGINLTRGTVPIFVWSDRGKSRKFPVAIVVVLAEIRSGVLPESGLRSFTDSANPLSKNITVFRVVTLCSVLGRFKLNVLYFI
jgi:hypothetical protein